MRPERPRPRSVSARPVGDLVGDEGQGEDARRASDSAMPAEMAARTPSTRRAGDEGGAEAADGAHHHHALDAEIEDAGALDHQLAEGGEQQRRRGRDDGEDDRLQDCPWRLLRRRRGGRLQRRQQAEAIEDERVAGEDEEQQDALEDLGDLVGQAERDLRGLAADDSSGASSRPAKRTPIGIEPAEEGDDDGGEAVARRDRRLELADGARDLEMPARPARPPDSRKQKMTMRVAREAGEAPGARRVAEHADLEALQRAAHA